MAKLITKVPHNTKPAVVLGWKRGVVAPVCLFTGIASGARKVFEAGRKSKLYDRVEWHNLGANSRRAKATSRK